LNVWEFEVKWNTAPTARDCLPQPGITDPNQHLDVLSYRQRPTWRLAHRTIGGDEVMVTKPDRRSDARHRGHPLVGGAPQRQGQVPGGQGAELSRA
jgi:hypothetical protein